MKYRNPIAVWLLPAFTFGIYFLVWCAGSKNELKRNGAEIPTMWLWLVPFVPIYWAWKYGEGVELVSKGRVSKGLAFCLLVFLGSIGAAIIQNEFNKISEIKKNLTMTAPQYR